MYELAMALAADVYAWVDEWPAVEKDRLGDQLIRAIDGVGANIAEAGGRVTRADRRRILGIAKGELDEVEHWLQVAVMRGLLAPDAVTRTEEIARMLRGLMKNPGRT